MLSIGKLVIGQQRYYDQQVAHGHDDYYSGRGEAPGEWIGAGARSLGLIGVVHAEDFNALLSGNDPRDSSRRLSGWRPSKVAALDLTFSAPKSVSVLFAVADEAVARELVAAHKAAVRATVGWLEDSAVQVRRGAGGHLTHPGEGLIAAAYRHRMSRALDPQLHTHVVAANMAKGPDGRFTALHGMPLYRAAKTGGYLYQAHLRAEISERLGLEWGAVRKGAAELADVPHDVLEEFSRRRHEMERAAQDGGFSLTSKRSAEAAAIDTRQRKHYGIETHTWREEIEARAAEHGLGCEEVAGLIAGGAVRIAGADPAATGADDDPQLRALADRLAGPDGLTERSNTFDDSKVLQAFAQAAEQGARVPSVRQRADDFGRREDVLQTRGEGMTTRDLVSCEHQLIEAAAGRADERCAVVSEAAISDAIASADRPLTGEQEAVVRGCASSGHGVDVVEALAGTGKTYTAGVLRQLYEQAGHAVIGLAPTGRGARELSDEAGIRAVTIDRALIELEQFGTALPERAVIVLDEAGMAPTRLSARLLGHAARAGAKVIAIGDSGQLPSVLAGGWLRAVGDRVGALELTEVMRQRDPAERRALGALHDGVPGLYLEWAAANNRIDVVRGDRITEQAVGEWIAAATEQAPGQTVMIARDNDTRSRLNELARAHRIDTGELGVAHVYGTTPVAVGERVICRHNDARVGVDNGTRGTVRHVDAIRIMLETDSGAVRELPASYVADHVEHAYCLTGHGMQGGTVARAVVVAAAEDLTAGWSYSALSRARGETRLLIADTDRRDAARAEHAPEEQRTDHSRGAVIARVQRRMLVRDDEDLAIDQVTPAGREDDRTLHSHRSSAFIASQETAAFRAEPIGPLPSVERLADLREQIRRLKLTLEALPTRPLAQFDELDAKACDLARTRAEHQERLDSLEAPKRRLGRDRDPHVAERSFLKTALELDDRSLAELAAERARLQRELGDPDQVRSEREGIKNALRELRGDRDAVREILAARAVEQRPGWLIETLGEQPEADRDRATWDAAAKAIAGFRLDHEVTDPGTPLGPEPRDASERRAREQMATAVERAQRQLGLDTRDRSHGVDLGLG